MRIAHRIVTSIGLRGAGFRRQVRGTAAVEFALIGPVFLAMLFGLISYGTLLGIENGVQQLAAESARASVGGLSSAERDQLARAYVINNVGAYAFLDPAKLTVATGVAAASSSTYQVSIVYDMSGSFVYGFGRWIGLPSSTLVRSAAVQFGGF